MYVLKRQKGYNGYRGDAVKRIEFIYGVVTGALLLFIGIISVYIEFQEKEIHEDIFVADEIKRENRAEIWVQPGKLSEEISPLNALTDGDINLMTLCFETPKVEIQKQTDSVIQVLLSVQGNGITNSGEKITADDLLFNLYLRFDPSMGEQHNLDTLEIQGEKEYFYGTNDVIYAESELKKQCMKPTKELLLLYQEKVVRPALKKELAWVKTIFGNPQYAGVTKNYQEPKDMFAHYFSYQTEYDAAKRTEEQVLEDIISQYGGNLSGLSKVTGKDYTKIQRAYTLASWCNAGKSVVNHITGIKKVDEKSVLLQVVSGKDSIEELKNMWILPVSQYGRKEKFDGVQSFGFEKGNTEKIIQKTSSKLMGSGYFYVREMDEKYIYLKRNSYALKGKNYVKSIKILREEFDVQKDMVHALDEHQLDLAITKDSTALNKKLSQKEGGTAYYVRKKRFRKGVESTCFIYRTSYLNTTTFPKQMNTSRDFFKNFGKIKVNLK